jgi:hypothetical protein
MRKFLLPLALVATLATGTAAFATTNSAVTGTVTAVDVKGETVALGKTVYHFAKGFDLSKITKGEKVTIMAHKYKTTEVGVSIVAAAPAPAKPAPMKPKAPAKTVTKTVTKTTTKTTK